MDELNSLTVYSQRRYARTRKKAQRKLPESQRGRAGNREKGGQKQNERESKDKEETERSNIDLTGGQNEVQIIRRSDS